MITHDTIIIGGGIAGLSAALHLSERGLHPLALEADPQYLGGRLAAEGAHAALSMRAMRVAVKNGEECRLLRAETTRADCGECLTEAG